jgi:hypothetical protein
MIDFAHQNTLGCISLDAFDHGNRAAGEDLVQLINNSKKLLPSNANAAALPGDGQLDQTAGTLAAAAEIEFPPAMRASLRMRWTCRRPSITLRPSFR